MDINWRILDLKRNLSDDLVREITYECKVIEGNDFQRKIGTIEIDGNINDPSFIAFNDLTEEVILTWLTNNLTETTMTEISGKLESEIIESRAIRAAITTKRGTPWNNRRRPNF